MYPCAGQDIADVVQAYGQLFDTFLFADIHYNFRPGVVPLIHGWQSVPESWTLNGSREGNLRRQPDARRGYRVIEPAWLSLAYREIETGRHVNVVQRRGFGQYALHEINDGSLNMFLHRGDSDGEGGSGTWFLANRRMRHPPLSMLLNVLKRKLKFPAFIGSDGSNTSIQQLLSASAGNDSIFEFLSDGMHWRRFGTPESSGSRQTVVWQVTPEDQISANHAVNVN